MTEPTRLVDDAGGDELETSLLKLARSEGPSAEGRRKILAGVAAAGAVTTTSHGANATAKTTTAKGAASALKWGLLGIAAVAVPVVIWSQRDGGTPATQSTNSPAASVASPETKAEPARPTVAEGPAPVSLQDLPVLPAPSQPVLSAPGKQQSSLAEEVAQLQKAKLALKAGSASQALAELNTYAQRFPRPMLGAEATIVRIEALRASGEMARAKQLAEGFLAKHPNSPYAARLRNLTGAR